MADFAIRPVHLKWLLCHLLGYHDSPLSHNFEESLEGQHTSIREKVCRCRTNYKTAARSLAMCREFCTKGIAQWHFWGGFIGLSLEE